MYDKKYAFQAVLSNIKGGLCILHLGAGGRKQRPWSNSLIIEDLVVSYTFLVSRSHFEPISSDFEGGALFSTFGGGGGL